MKLHNINPIAILFSILILLQSCTVYYNTPSSTKKASQQTKGRIKVNMKDGNKHIYNWIEGRDKSILTITNTKKEVLDKSNILQIVKNDPNPSVITLDSALHYKGSMQVLTINEKGKYASHEFIRVFETDSLIHGIKMIKSDTSTIVLQKNEIESIKLQNKSASTVGNVVIGIGAFLGILTIYGIYDINQNGIGGNPLGGGRGI